MGKYASTLTQEQVIKTHAFKAAVSNDHSLIGRLASIYAGVFLTAAWQIRQGRGDIMPHFYAECRQAKPGYLLSFGIIETVDLKMKSAGCYLSGVDLSLSHDNRAELECASELITQPGRVDLSDRATRYSHAFHDVVGAKRLINQSIYDYFTEKPRPFNTMLFAALN